MTYVSIDAQDSGVPQGTGHSKAVALISGGIDSPVAAWLIGRRGVSLDFVHFHSYPFSCSSAIEKAKELYLKVRNREGSELLLVPFLELQEAVLRNIPNRYRIVVYRRAMAVIAERIAQMKGASFIVTGDSLGQVSSQTLQNLATVDSAVSLPIVRPLIGFDKTEIIEIARKIGTYDISIRPHEDCCTLFAAGNPATRTVSSQIKAEEEKIDLMSIVKRCVDSATRFNAAVSV
ncbi:MAG: hypothetical protein KIY12_00815 [Thermoplasmata archaeon]|uniref:Probable tRNA sulfurtransferase n=1 Tax=Candidatus Sysuiplasma superficiale TaxID=2823368 RepID=A0A8J7YQH0_9ARCH|nr:hypothetical protein [Candidatus Sysuiplasma superficiale]MBX8643263.1 hypothetical protein [Candidatus Sysuiplasma superficiale]